MLTDTIQMLIFVFGGLMGTGFALHLVGGLSGMFDKLSREDIGLESFRHVLQPASDSIVPWYGFVLFTKRLFSGRGRCLGFLWLVFGIGVSIKKWYNAF